MSIRVSAAKPSTICVRARPGASATARSAAACAASSSPNDCSSSASRAQASASPGCAPPPRAAPRAPPRARSPPAARRTARSAPAPNPGSARPPPWHRPAPRRGGLCATRSTARWAKASAAAGSSASAAASAPPPRRPGRRSAAPRAIGVPARIARRRRHLVERGERAGIVVRRDPRERALQPRRQRSAVSPAPSGARTGG